MSLAIATCAAEPERSLKEETPILRMEASMRETSTKKRCISYRHWLKFSQELLSLIYLALKIYELLQNLHLI